ncbi:GTP cyclohydrolase, FolE2/MptA family [Halomonas cupida]|uniref:GTP cyclohydrolase, FolE2/MptA family n=1 Tax=Halomonas cupida TaxID=44933 RepID=UPI003EF74568
MNRTSTDFLAAVKRIKERSFALANDHNPMFCADASRRLHHAMHDHPHIQGRGHPAGGTCRAPSRPRRRGPQQWNWQET